MNNAQRTEIYQIAVSDLADELLDRELAKGEAFSEALCNWAISQAEQQIVGRPIVSDWMKNRAL